MKEPRNTVLVVEDEESFVEALTIGLEREGFRVHVARDGVEAIDVFDDLQPDLVLAEAAERVRSVAEHRNIRLDIHEPPRRLKILGDRRQLVSAAPEELAARGARRGA